MSKIFREKFFSPKHNKFLCQSLVLGSTEREIFEEVKWLKSAIEAKWVGRGGWGGGGGGVEDWEGGKEFRVGMLVGGLLCCLESFEDMLIFVGLAEGGGRVVRVVGEEKKWWERLVGVVGVGEGGGAKGGKRGWDEFCHWTMRGELGGGREERIRFLLLESFLVKVRLHLALGKGAGAGRWGDEERGGEKKQKKVVKGILKREGLNFDSVYEGRKRKRYGREWLGWRIDVERRKGGNEKDEEGGKSEKKKKKERKEKKETGKSVVCNLFDISDVLVEFFVRDCLTWFQKQS